MQKIISEKSLYSQLCVIINSNLIDKADGNYLKLCLYFLEWNDEFMSKQVSRIFNDYCESIEDRRVSGIVAFSEQYLLDNINEDEYSTAIQIIDETYENKIR